MEVVAGKIRLNGLVILILKEDALKEIIMLNAQVIQIVFGVQFCKCALSGTFAYVIYNLIKITYMIIHWACILIILLRQYPRQKPLVKHN